MHLLTLSETVAALQGVAALCCFITTRATVARRSKPAGASPFILPPILCTQFMFFLRPCLPLAVRRIAPRAAVVVGGSTVLPTAVARATIAASQGLPRRILGRKMGWS